MDMSLTIEEFEELLLDCGGRYGRTGRAPGTKLATHFSQSV